MCQDKLLTLQRYMKYVYFPLPLGHVQFCSVGGKNEESEG